MKFVIFETQIAKVSSLEICSHENYSAKALKYSPQFNQWQGLVPSKTSKALPGIRIFDTLFLYDMLQ